MVAFFQVGLVIFVVGFFFFNWLLLISGKPENSDLGCSPSEKNVVAPTRHEGALTP